MSALPVQPPNSPSIPHLKLSFQILTVSSRSLASSKPFLFTIGASKREFSMHSALVASQSPAFERLVNNSNFKEGQSYHAELGNIEEETFIRFLQYAYTGKYDEGEVQAPPADKGPIEASAAGPGPEPEPEPEPVPKPVKPAYDSWGFGTSSSAKKNLKRKGPKTARWDEHTYVEPAEEATPIRTTPEGIYDQTTRTIVFEALSQKFATRVSILAAGGISIPANKIQVGGPATSNPYLLHAKVFVFADYWGVTGLKEVSLRKLSSALQEVGLLVNTKWVRDRLVALVEYCYEEPRPEELVSLVHLYASFRLPQLWESEKFQELFRRHAELSVALMRAVVESGL